MLQHEKEVSTITLNNSVEYLPGPYFTREEGIGKTKAQNGMQTASYCNHTLRRTASKQLHTSHEVPC